MTEAERTKLINTAKANGKPIDGKPKAKKKGQAPPELPSVTTHGTHVDVSDVLDALTAVPGMPLPDQRTARHVWTNQDRALILRWAKSPTRDTDIMPEALDKWLMGHGAATSALGGVEPVTEAPVAAADNVEPPTPMSIEELREIVESQWQGNDNDLKNLINPLGYEHKMQALVDSPQWPEYQEKALQGEFEGTEEQARISKILVWWEDGLTCTDGWKVLATFVEQITDPETIFTVFVRPIASLPAPTPMPIEELREYMLRKFDPNKDDLSAVLTPLGIDYERFDLEDCAPHWQEYQELLSQDPYDKVEIATAAAAGMWWLKKLQAQTRADGWDILDVYIPREAFENHGKLFAVIVRPSQDALSALTADAPAADAPADTTPEDTTTPSQPAPSWLTTERQLQPSGVHEPAIERMQLNPKLEHELTERMVNLWRDLENVEQEKKEVMKEYGDKIKHLKESLGRTSESLRNGWEDRSIPCQWYYDFAVGVAELRRNDDGVVMKTRGLTADERQLQLQLDEDRHLDDAEQQLESERDKFIAQCVRKAHELRPALKTLYDYDSYERCQDFPKRPDGWPYNPSATVLHTWSDVELAELLTVLNAVEIAHTENGTPHWPDYVPAVGTVVDGAWNFVFSGENALYRYWLNADDNGVMPDKPSGETAVEELVEDVVDGGGEG